MAGLIDKATVPDHERIDGEETLLHRTPSAPVNAYESGDARVIINERSAEHVHVVNEERVAIELFAREPRGQHDHVRVVALVPIVCHGTCASAPGDVMEGVLAKALLPSTAR